MNLGNIKMDKLEIKFRQKLKPNYTRAYGGIYHFWGYLDNRFVSPFGKNNTLGNDEQFSGLKDSQGIDIYEGDKVYLAGFGVYEVEFPFTELYEAKMENDLGKIL